MKKLKSLGRMIFYIKFNIMSFISNIKNIFKWFPVIWNDRQWDYSYLYKILHKKISLMQEFYETESILVEEENKKIIKELKFVKNTIERLINDEYFSETENKNLSKIHNEYKFIPVDENNLAYKLETNFDMHNSDLDFYYKDERYKKDRDMKYLFYTLYKNIEGWWE